MLQSIIQGNRAMGMCMMDDSLLEAVESGKVSATDAYAKATDKARFEPLMRREQQQAQAAQAQGAPAAQAAPPTPP